MAQQQDQQYQVVKTEPVNKFGIFDKTQKDIQELRTQNGFINAEIVGMKARVDRVETSIAAVNETISNTGLQIFSGEVGSLSILLICSLLAIGISSYFQYQIAKLKKVIKTKIDNDELNND